MRSCFEKVMSCAPAVEGRTRATERARSANKNADRAKRLQDAWVISNLTLECWRVLATTKEDFSAANRGVRFAEPTDGLWSKAIYHAKHAAAMIGYVTDFGITIFWCYFRVCSFSAFVLNCSQDASSKSGRQGFHEQK